METRGYKWLLKALAWKKTQLKVLETYLVRQGIVEAKIYTDSLGRVKSKKNIASGHLTISDAMNDFLSQHTQLIRTSGETLAIVYHRNGRLFLSRQSVMDFIQKPNGTPSVFAVQKMEPHLDDQYGIYSLRIFYLNHQYDTEFTIIKEKSRKKVKDKVSFQQIKDIGIVILRTIEEIERKRLLSLDLEFIKDENGNFWLAFCSDCKVIDPEICLTKDFSSLKDIEESTISKNYSNNFTSADETQEKIPENKYVLKRGQLRNVDSKLSSPIRVVSPRDSSDEEVQASPKKVVWSKFQQTLKAKILAAAVITNLAKKVRQKTKAITSRRKKYINKTDHSIFNKIIKSSINETQETSQDELTVNSNFLELASKTQIKSRYKGLSFKIGFEFEDADIKKEKQRILAAVKENPQNRSLGRLNQRELFWDQDITPREKNTKSLDENGYLNPKKFQSAMTMRTSIRPIQSYNELVTSSANTPSILGKALKSSMNRVIIKSPSYEAIKNQQVIHY
ncbi:unnamed protein product [Blepharisma stoltei]|uniref:Uncharacterized protein n=1 Tax=Blepharisma stoltei TaxID=1481888 RepID=A0AAU9J8N9_9CILI|nr:unnamed protein product [Blepharisma stoltei]